MPRWLVITLAAVLMAVAGWFVFAFAMGLLYSFVTTAGNAKPKKPVAEALAFGRNRTAEECIVEALRRADRCEGTSCATGARDFLASALQASGKEPVCARVWRHSPVGWVESECALRGRSDVNCQIVLRGVLDACSLTR